MSQWGNRETKLSTSCTLTPSSCPIFSQWRHERDVSWRQWLMSSKLKRTALSDVRYPIFVFEVGGSGYSVRCWVGVCHRDTDTLLISSTYPYSLYYVLYLWVSINRNYLMLLRMRCFVYFVSGRILFSLWSSVYLAVAQISTAANTQNIYTVYIHSMNVVGAMNQLDLVCSAGRQKHIVNNL